MASRRKIADRGSFIRILVNSVYEAEDERSELASALRQAGSGDDGRDLAALFAAYQTDVDAITDDDRALEFIVALPVAEAVRDDLLERVVKRAARYSILPRESVQAVDDVALEQALLLPLDLWRVFLHPRQRSVAYAPLAESAFLTGGPGTGKTVCIVHRVRHITQQIGDDEVVVLTTYKEHLEAYIGDMLKKLGVDLRKVVITDVASFKIRHEYPSGSARLHGFFVIDGGIVSYLQHGDLGGHPKPATRGHLKTGHHDR